MKLSGLSQMFINRCETTETFEQVLEDVKAINARHAAIKNVQQLMDRLVARRRLGIDPAADQWRIEVLSEAIEVLTNAEL